jgi:hypothetical protein
MEICVDFDGTCVTHDYPGIGKDIGAVPVLKRLIEAGHQLILFTMRSDTEQEQGDEFFTFGFEGNYLTDAVNWFKENGIELYGINENPSQKFWTRSPKAFADIYIDDAALGCPVISNTEISARPFADWKAIEHLLEIRGVLESSRDI